MAAADDAPPTDDEAVAHPDRAGAGRTGDPAAGAEGGANGPTAAMRHNIDRVADKVKNLLRADR